jgi:hypothetical protein
MRCLKPAGRRARATRSLFATNQTYPNSPTVSLTAYLLV